MLPIGLESEKIVEVLLGMVADRALKTAKVATLLDTSQDTVLRLIGNGSLRGWGLGKDLRVNQSEINRFLREAERTGQVSTSVVRK